MSSICASLNGPPLACAQAGMAVPLTPVATVAHELLRVDAGKRFAEVGADPSLTLVTMGMAQFSRKSACPTPDRR